MAAQAQGMVERRGAGLWLTHVVMITGVLIIFFPIWLAFVASTVTQPEIVSPPMPVLPGDHFWDNYSAALFAGVNVPVARMLMNSLIMAVGIAVGKIAISLLSAFAIVYFRFPGRSFFFWTIFLTLMLPVEVRIVPTFEVVAGFGMLNSYYGLIFPLIASATATFLFRQFFMTIPDELAEAARVDGAQRSLDSFFCGGGCGGATASRSSSSGTSSTVASFFPGCSGSGFGCAASGRGPGRECTWT